MAVSSPRNIFIQLIEDPVTQGSMRSIRTKTGKTVTVHEKGSRLAMYRASIKEQAMKKWRGGPSEYPIKLDLKFFFAAPKKPRNSIFPITRSSGDIDKLERAILDALTNIVYRDDSQVVSVVKVKGYHATPQVWIGIEEIGIECQVKSKSKRVVK